MPFVMTASTVLPHVAIVRRSLIRLRAEVVVSGLFARLGGRLRWRRRLQGRCKNGWCGNQQQKTQTLFHESRSGGSSGLTY
jgi:hypothetical protein